MSSKLQTVIRLLIIPVLVGMSGGGGLAWLSPGSFLQGWFSSGFLLAVSVLLLTLLWIWAGGDGLWAA